MYSSIEDFKLFFESQGFSYTIPIDGELVRIPYQKYCFSREEFKVHLYPSESGKGFRLITLTYDRPTSWTDIDY